jgi:hypothetical protein
VALLIPRRNVPMFLVLPKYALLRASAASVTLTPWRAAISKATLVKF